MENKPKVSVIINCRNGEKYLNETLASLRGQSFRDFELVFWDNCSADHTGRIARTFDARLKYFRSDRLMPLGEARNEALKQVQGEYIAFLDADDFWEKDKLKIQVSLMDANPDAGMTCSNFRQKNMLNGETQVHLKKSGSRKMGFAEFVTDYRYCMSTFMLRKKAVEGLDYCFDGRLNYAEEYEMFARIALNWTVYYTDRVLATYRIHSKMSSVRLSGKRIAGEYDACLRSLKKADSSIGIKYPEAVKWIQFMRDLFAAKHDTKMGKNAEVRKRMRPYLRYNYRALAFFINACLPAVISRYNYKKFYDKRGF